MKLLSICAVRCAVVLITLVPATTVQAHRSDTAALEEYSRIQGELQRNVQAMQSEMAELRNQIERQQFELAKSRAQRASIDPYANGAQPRFVPSDNGLVAAPSVSGNPAFEPNSSSAMPPSVTPTNNNFPTTEERVLNPNAVPSGTSQFPPVEERQIGGGAARGVPTPPMDTPVPSDRAGGPVIVGTPIEAVPTNGGSVIAIPNEVSTPSERDSLPATNAIPQESIPSTNPADGAIDATLGEAELYQQAFELLRQSKHNEAVDVFLQQIKDFPYGEYADDANYWIAESKYVNRDLAESKKHFKVIIDQYKQSPRLPDAMLKTAYIEQEQGNKIEARILLQEILQYHPRSNAAISAKNRLAELST